ncbi:hypothetical protein KKC08_04845 [Patescibacteria group bacterium]|nr:hypothetical protein [Patescibacteria group bacterium]MCG2701636.1 hypothetical protein [Candidatus Parcubacteria bacterium]MBU4265522.1 hypothetical protein [Patescibacteria group bacterium]MBU4389850.1 hypothetical protein [Patescibacteria group bacterium]MBU4397464.1 hypothetical protein [Patescibacteria group bacterium]
MKAKQTKQSNKQKWIKPKITVKELSLHALLDKIFENGWLNDYSQEHSRLLAQESL